MTFLKTVAGVEEWIAEEEGYVCEQLPHKRADYVVLDYEEQAESGPWPMIPAF